MPFCGGEPSRRKSFRGTEKVPLNLFLLRGHQQTKTMINKSIFLEILIFFLILVFLILPPVIAPGVSAGDKIFTWTFPFRQIGLGIFAVVLFVLSKGLNTKKGFFYPGFFALTFMFFVALLIRFITKNSVKEFDFALPSGGLQWIFCVLTFLFSAVYEEVIYRFYFADALYRILGYTRFGDKKSTLIICQALALLAFAFAHLYLGILAVINAAVAHLVLTYLYKKTNFIWNCVLVHFLYNIISLILL